MSSHVPGPDSQATRALFRLSPRVRAHHDHHRHRLRRALGHPHTGLWVPHDRLRVTSPRELPTCDGVVFTATPRLGKHKAGVIENHGTGGSTLFRPDPKAGFGYRELNEYAAACRKNGEPVSTETVLNDLVEEYDVARLVKRYAAKGGTVARLMSADGYRLADARIPRMPATPAQRQRIAEYLAGELSEPGAVWQLWTGQHCEPLPHRSPGMSGSRTGAGSARPRLPRPSPRHRIAATGGAP